MNRASLLAIVVGLGCAGAHAAPFLPGSDAQVLERLPYKASDPLVAELRADRAALAQEPENLRLALRLAGRYIELGRVNGDPRYAGYAQAALTPWWSLERPPKQVLLLRATLKQRVHDFYGARADLDALLRIDPWNAQARLTRATVLQVQGQYAAAQRDCSLLQHSTAELIAITCSASLQSVTGGLRGSYEELKSALLREPQADPGIRSWALTALAEMAARAGMATEAEGSFRQALALAPGDFYLLGAYADFLLDQHRPGEAASLVKDATRADPLLLRYALALEAESSPQWPAVADQLRDRFGASRLRGDRVHLREEARFTLHVLNEPDRALQLARENWRVQREPADARVLLEAALASGNRQSLIEMKNWLRESKLQDIQIERLLSLDHSM